MTLQLNTLFVTLDGAWLHKERETLVVKQDGVQRLQVPLLHLASVACFGRVGCTPELMAALSESGIHVSFFSPHGRLLARVEGVPGGNVLLRREQYRVADDPKRTLEIARAMVVGKVSNARAFLLHARRDAAEERKPVIAEACDRLVLHLRALARATSVDEVRGLEGIAARDYFSVFSLLLKRQEEAFRFDGRSRRPPKDRINALLSFGYALLMQDCAAALAGVGLDPAVGFLHEERPGRLSLALDLMEEFRVVLVDRFVVSLVNRGRLSSTDFIEEPNGAWRLTDASRKTFLISWQENKRGELRHEFLQQNAPWSRMPHLQALLLARTLRKDLDTYPPFSMR
ncbi:type I-C CRISPR-associated endonuclease Cas1c [Cystobacter ferrugineus]|uniref:CRISPR-associated endonuclease Cas1 n=1 Tax=Cystobacter ferrugineus TaxID=83449 RepID=A0A1L9B6L8_9BACT|nr:type I-C CRISPR-associated endonuclease Cas1c [Cystobacter ferrugineus]OJH37895.1 subtype I-C CRISPR-associated endonuclease Cas1 [Cystobacter ferrugineus]